MSLRDCTIDAVYSNLRIRHLLLLLALLLLLFSLLLLLLIDLPVLFEGFLLLDSGEDVVGFQVLWVVLADSAILHLFKFLEKYQQEFYVGPAVCWPHCVVKE